MSICFFTAKYVDGSGDIVQTLKTADRVQQWAAPFGNEVIVVVPDEENGVDHEAITKNFAKDINQRVKITSISDFLKSNPQVDCCIQAGYTPLFHWRKQMGDLINDTTAMVYITEYNSGWTNAPYKSKSKQIYTGFNKEQGKVGVIPNQFLLEATATEQIPDATLKIVYDTLTPRMKKYLGEDYESFQKHIEQHGISYQYSHDRREYSYIDNERENNQYPVALFLKEHMMLVSESPQSQDVFCFGENEDRKKYALEQELSSLVANGYSKITFVNMDTNEEEVLHEANTAETTKEYRLLYSKQVPFSTMQVLPLLADDIVGVTGDNSLVEAMSAGKLVSYECFGHKTQLVDGYLKAVQQKTSNQDVRELAQLLMKSSAAGQIDDYDPNRLTKLLKDRATVDELKTINRQIVNDTQYFNTLREIVTPALATPQIKPQSTPITYVTKENTPVWAPDANNPSNQAIYAEAIRDRYPHAYGSEENIDTSDNEYYENIRTLTHNIEDLQSPEAYAIQTVIDDWFFNLSLEQQNRFRSEMPLMVNDIKQEYLDKLRPVVRANLETTTIEVVLNLMREIHKLHNPTEEAIILTINNWKSNLSSEKQEALTHYLESIKFLSNPDTKIDLSDKTILFKQQFQSIVHKNTEPSNEDKPTIHKP